MATVNDITLLVRKRGIAKRSLTNVEKFLAGENLPPHQVNVTFKSLPDILHEFKEIQDEIEISVDEPDKHYFERDEFMNRYRAALARCDELLGITVQISPPVSIGSEASSNKSLRTNKVKLPVINLPTFNGKYTEYLNFKSTFESLVINNAQLDNVERLHYLISSLQGEPKELIKNISICDESFQIAWNLIDERYNNLRIIATHHVKRLLDLPSAVSGQYQDYRHLVNCVTSNLQAIKRLGDEVPIYELLLVEGIVSKMKYADRQEFETRSSNNEFYVLSDLIQFIERKCQALEVLNADKPSGNVRPRPKNNAKCMAAQTAPTDSRNYNPPCPCCNGRHFLYDCQNFKSMNTDQRWQVVTSSKVCAKCLKTVYYNKHKCHHTPCNQCRSPHHNLLHGHNSPRQESSKQTANNNNSSSSNNNRHNNNAETNPELLAATTKVKTGLGANTVLMTAVVNVKSRSGTLIPVRAFLDSGSQLSFITSSMAERLGLQPKKCSLPIVGINNSPTASITSTCKVEMSSRFSNFELQMNCAVINNITGNLPSQQINHSSWNLPNDIKLSDPNFGKVAPVDLLLGADVFFDILLLETRTREGFPTLINTKFGWVLSGKFPNVNREVNRNPRVVSFLKVDSIDDSLQRFWELEEIPERVMSSEEKLCEEHFVKNTTRDADGRFVVKLPVRPDAPPLGESRRAAVRRLERLERRFDKNPQLKKEYVKFMKEYIDLDHMQETTNEEVSSNPYYLPHHCVLKEASTTTKLRVVFDGSAESSNGNSLNSVLMVGPVVQPDLFSIVLRFRSFKIALSADIAKMYRCVRVHPDDRKLQRIVWRESTDEPIRDYNLNTVTYGTGPASFLATRALNQLALENQSEHPIIAKAILSCFYVDDLLGGCNTVEEAKALQQGLTSVLASGDFQIRKWCSNSVGALENVPMKDRETLLPHPLADDASVHTLGLLWSPTTDNFQFQVNVKELKCPSITKRSILSIVASIYDPLGLLAPVIIKCKVLLQGLWQAKVSWDDPLSSELIHEWGSIHKELPLLNDIYVPRKLIPFSNVKQVELHGFCDASEKAYGCCIYVRSISMNNNVSIVLLTSKSRVAPLKKQSLPRLELCGALLLAKLMSKAISALQFDPVVPIYLWTDSTIVLSWLQRPSNTWKTFVANRISEIQSLTTVTDWRHVSSSDNPADHVSRGVYPSELKQLYQWWEGPEWLHDSHMVYQPFIDVNASNVEIKEKPVIVSMVVKTAFHENFLRFSSFARLYRTYAYVLRFIKNCKSKKNRNVSVLSVEEINASISKIMFVIQRTEFASEIRALKSKQAVPCSSKLKSLNVFIDNDLLRVGGRLLNTDLPFNAKHPIVIPSSHHVTKLLIMSEHLRLLHSGPQAVLTSLRARFWFTNGRNTVQGVLRKCLKCFKVKPTSYNPIMGQLPSCRVNFALPFSHVGVDYGGPILIKGDSARSKIQLKIYICLFICMVTKAVHLEMVRDLTAESFIVTLKRFVSRRGLPNIIFSDNGTNFVGANKEIMKFFKNKEEIDKIKEFGSSQGFTWKFIPPNAPNFGGLWEAGIKSTKSLLKKVVGTHMLTADEFTTLLCQIEACLNSRPICTLSDNPAYASALTPGHFIVGRAICALPEPVCLDLATNRLTRWQLIQQMKQRFWKDWSTSYLQQLQQRPRWQRSGRWNPEVGQAVLIMDDGAPPLHWKMGVIQDLHPGPDGITRVATVKCVGGNFKRPINKLCPLPSDSASCP